MDIKSALLPFLNFWPPLLFSGIKIVEKSKDYRFMRVKLGLRFWNKNYVGTQYGGSIFSMTDPFYMLMLMKNLGSDYIIWDKSAKISYLKPGKTDLFAEFILSKDDLVTIRKAVLEQNSINWTRHIEIKDKNSEVVAVVEKEISIKQKKLKVQKNEYTL